MSKHILIVEDDQDLSDILSLTLSNAGYSVTVSTTPKECEASINNNTPDLVILDINLNLPECNGLDLCRQLRKKLTIPILILSGSNDDTDKLLALELGANNYLNKPISPRVLLSFVKTTFNPPSEPISSTENAEEPVKVVTTRLDFGPYSLDLAHQTLHSDSGKTIRITATEFKILHLFLQNPYRVLSRDKILDYIEAEEAYDRSIDRFIGKLRNKIEEDPKNPKFIKSIYGSGYVFEEDVVKKERKQ